MYEEKDEKEQSTFPLISRVEKICTILEKLDTNELEGLSKKLKSDADGDELEKLNAKKEFRFLSGAVWLACMVFKEKKGFSPDDKLGSDYQTFIKIRKALGEDEFEKVVHKGSVYLNIAIEMKALEEDILRAFSEENLRVERDAQADGTYKPGIKGVGAEDMFPVSSTLFRPSYSKDRLERLKKLFEKIEPQEKIWLPITSEFSYVFSNLYGCLQYCSNEESSFFDNSETIKNAIVRLKTADLIERRAKSLTSQDREGDQRALQEISQEITRLEPLLGNQPIQIEKYNGGNYQAMPTERSDEDLKPASKMLVAAINIGMEGAKIDLMRQELNAWANHEFESQLNTSQQLASSPSSVREFVQAKIEEKSGIKKYERDICHELSKNENTGIKNLVIDNLEQNLKRCLSITTHSRVVFNKNKWRIILASILTAILLGGLTAIILFFSPFLWLKIAAPILMAALIAVLTIGIGLTPKLSHKAKQILLGLSMSLIASASTLTLLMEFGFFSLYGSAKSSLFSLLKPLLGTLLNAQIVVTAIIAVFTLIVLWQLYRGIKKLGWIDKVESSLTPPSLEKVKRKERAYGLFFGLSFTLVATLLAVESLAYTLLVSTPFASFIVSGPFLLIAVPAIFLAIACAVVGVNLLLESKEEFARVNVLRDQEGAEPIDDQQEERRALLSPGCESSTSSSLSALSEHKRERSDAQEERPPLKERHQADLPPLKRRNSESSLVVQTMPEEYPEKPKDEVPRRRHSLP